MDQLLGAYHLLKVLVKKSSIIGADNLGWNINNIELEKELLALASIGAMRVMTT